uniref:Uncharacterized protein n=1 Tax=Glossina pallidipes TaxID=7398 RepID=A0A1A9ZAF6_GLOPL
MKTLLEQAAVETSVKSVVPLEEGEAPQGSQGNSFTRFSGCTVVIVVVIVVSCLFYSWLLLQVLLNFI